MKNITSFRVLVIMGLIGKIIAMRFILMSI